MKPRKSAYLLHRWLGLLVSLQLLAWSTGGLIFSVLALDLVRGERDSHAAPLEPIDPTLLALLPEPVRAQTESLMSTGAAPAAVALLDRGLGPAWEARSAVGTLLARLDPATGAPLGRISPDDAARVATRDFAHAATVKSVRLIESDPPVEYRSGVLPAYAVELDHPRRPRLYIDAHTGQITARRNRLWRIFDFFWMLHTMDYAGRDDFNHPLLTAFSVLAIATASSGLALWLWRALSRFRPGAK